MSSWWRDIRYAARALLRTPLFTLGIVLTLALGIGVNAAMFGVVDLLFLRPPAGVRDPSHVVRIYKRSEVVLMHRVFTSGIGQFPAFQDLHDADVFDGVAATTSRDLSLGRGAEAVRVSTGLVSHDYFRLLGVTAARGRFFGADEDKIGGERVAVLSDAFWRSHFAADTAVIGRTVQMGRGNYTVVGIAPRGFTGIELAPVDLWLPIRVAGADFSSTQCLTSRNCWWMEAIARLKPGDRPENAASRATAVYRRGSVPEHPDDSTAAILLGPTQAARGPEMNATSRVSAWVGAVAAVVLLIACANVANLLLARGVSRRRELAVRTGLGAGRGGLVRLLLAESLVLSGLGGAGAVLLAVWGGTAARALLIPNLPAGLPVVDTRILAFTAVTVLVTTFLAGIVPALLASRTDVAETLKGGGHGSTSRGGRTRGALLAAQVALTLVLLVGAGLFVRSLRNAQGLDLGFDADKVVMATVELNSAGYGDAEADATYLRIMDRVSKDPAVERVAATTAPFGWMFASSFKVEGIDSLPSFPGGGPYQYTVTPGYFATLGTRIVRGRDFTDADRAGSAPAAIVNQAMASGLWPREAAIGKCLYIGGQNLDVAKAPCSRIVGIVADQRQFLNEASRAQYYVPRGQGAGGRLNGLYARARGAPGLVVGAVQRAFEAEGNLPRARVRTVADHLAPEYRSWRLGAAAFSAFGLLAPVIAAMGIFAVISYSVSQRTNEIGIRMALGAEASQVARMVLGQGLGVASLGVAVGAGGAFALGRGIRSLLYHVAPADPLVFVSVTGVLIAVATAAAYLPARRAAKVDPMVALRYE